MVQDAMVLHAPFDVNQVILQLGIEERNVAGVENLGGIGKVNLVLVRLVIQLNQFQMIQT